MLVAGVNLQVGIRHLFQAPRAKRFELLIQFRRRSAYRHGAHLTAAHHLQHLLYPPRTYPLEVHLRTSAQQRPLVSLPSVPQARLVGLAIPHLRYLKFHAPQPPVQRSRLVAITVTPPAIAALVPAGAHVLTRLLFQNPLRKKLQHRPRTIRSRIQFSQNRH